MSVFAKEIGVGNMDGGVLSRVAATVDTGASHSVLPVSLLAALRVQPYEQETYTLADGSQREYGYGFARIAIDGREFPCPVVFGDEEVYLLGATTLEIFGLMVDPTGEQLVRREYRARPL